MNSNEDLCKDLTLLSQEIVRLELTSKKLELEVTHLKNMYKFPVNEYGLEFPIPYIFWPEKCRWAHITDKGSISFEEHKPEWHSLFSHWTVQEGRVQYWGNISSLPNDLREAVKESPTKCIWERP